MLLKAGIALMAFALALTAVAVAMTVAFRDEPERAVASESSPETTVEPLVRSKPTVEPWVEKTQEPAPEAQAEPEPAPEPEPEPRPEPPLASPANEAADWPMPTDEEVEAASEPRRYQLPPGAVMGLTIESLGLHDVPVFDSAAAWALEGGVSHEPGTSMPWSSEAGEQRNVYLQGHRLGWPGTGSHLVFYHLNRLERGDEISLKNRDGKKFVYKVTETFVVEPDDAWVMGRVRGRDMVTLQTCTPIPKFDKRLIVRADRV